ncbi:MinD/ParA family ATP-binding protein [Klenkia terrae]|uniref:AAA family ATPase n=1 Tax=Klenkia terrae TaxID=1052259 RepID=A0ABU8EAE4_9ACTN
MSDRPADPTPDDPAAEAGTPSEEARRKTDGDRWQASLDSWSTDGAQAGADEERGTQEIRLSPPPGGPAAESWEQTAQQPSVPAEERSWEQHSQEHIASWQQPPSWQQAAEAERPRTEAPAEQPAPSWRPADQPVGQPASWEQQPSWEQQRSWEQAPQQQVPSHQVNQQAPQQPAWEPPPGARPWEQQLQAPQPAAPAAQPEPQQQPPAPEPVQQGQWAQQQPAPGGWGSQGSATWTPDQQSGQPQPAGPPPSLTSQSLLRQAAETPTRGWRRFLHKASGGTVNPGLSQAEIEHRALVQRVTTPVRGSNRIAVVSLKGGIGKTTTTCCLGLTLAHHRGDRVVAVDANPDAGTLAERLTNVTDVTVRDLLAATDRIRSFTDVSAFTSLAGRLQVLASDQDPALSEAFSEEEYTTVADILARYFNIILTDSGTGLLHSAMSGTLAIADSLVVVGAPSVDGASRASKTLDWLIAHGHEELVSRSVAVISSVRPNTGDVDMGMVRAHFAARCRAVVEIPYDTHLVTGGLIDLDRVGAPARQAYLELAAHVADGFALPPLTRRPATA